MRTAVGTGMGRSGWSECSLDLDDVGSAQGGVHMCPGPWFRHPCRYSLPPAEMGEIGRLELVEKKTNSFFFPN
jgi:hypothetical protein